MGEFAKWCREVQDELKLAPVLRREWTTRVSPAVVAELRTASENELVELSVLLQDDLVARQFQFLSDDPKFRKRGERIHRSIRGLVLARLQNADAIADFCNGMDSASEDEGEWAKATWTTFTSSGALSQRLVESNLVSFSGSSARLDPISIVEVEGPWIGIRPHPVFAATSIFDQRFEATIERAWKASCTLLADQKVDCDKALCWWTQPSAGALDGDSHGGMVAAMIVALLRHRGLDPHFVASAALSAEDPLVLSQVGDAQEKARVVVDGTRRALFFVHVDNLEQATIGAAAKGHRDQVVAGKRLIELIELSERFFAVPLTLSRSEAQRLFENDEQIVNASHNWVSMNVQTAGLDGLQQSEVAGDAIELYPRLIIEGDAGAGKSWLLRRLVASCWQRFRPDSLGRVHAAADAWAAMHVQASNLSGWLAGTGDYFEGLTAITPDASLPKEDIVAAMREGRYALAVDNAEALGRNESWELANRLAAMTVSSPKFRYYVTVRSGTEAAQVLSKIEVRRAYLLPLGQSQVREMLTVLTGGEEEFTLRAIATAESIRLFEFADNPILVSLFVEGLRGDRYAIRAGAPTRHGIYDRFVTVCLDKLDSPDIKREPFIIWMRQVAERVAENMSRRSLRDRFTELEFKQAVDELEHARLPSPVPFDCQIIRRQLLKSGLFIAEQDAENPIRFRHQTVAEYLSAGSAARSFEDALRRGEQHGRDVMRHLASSQDRSNILQFIPFFCRDPLKPIELLLEEIDQRPSDHALLSAMRMVKEVHAVVN